MPRPSVLPILRATLALLLPATAHAQQVDYARDVLPLLSNNCYKCHGPDEPARKEDLRLDTPDGVFRHNNGEGVVTPGKPDQSELVRRITSKDPELVMPPLDDPVRKLTPDQIATLTRWVEQGAKWGAHWSFVPPAAPADPNPTIDSLIRARLTKEHLQPSPEADRPTLLRRITFDLTGLPPTSAELDAFLSDPSENAYEKVVNRLLASPRYGERMAADWLDLARYADTHGYQMDRYRPVWPYRDWVIKAFNENLPFDQFITWQLAGDLLPSPTKEQQLATAFNRLHMQNEEGGIVAEEFRVAYNVDRVTTAGTAFLGLTFECARCHDHKYDPITQRDFYSLYAFFQNIDESGQTSYFTDATPTPALALSTDDQDNQLADLTQKITAKETELSNLRAAARADFEKWRTTDGKVTLPPPSVRLSFDDPAATQPAKPVESPTYVEGHSGKAAQLNGDNGFTLPKDIGAFSRTDPFSLSCWLKIPTTDAPSMVVAHKSKAPADAASRGYELLLESGHVSFALHHFWPGDSLKITTKLPIPPNTWTHITATYDGSSRAAGAHIYINGLPAEVQVIRDNLTRDITYSGDDPPLTLGHRFRDAGLKDGAIDDFAVFPTSLTPAEAATLADIPVPEGTLFTHYTTRLYPPALAAFTSITTLRQQHRDLLATIPTIMVMREMPTTKPAHILKRGAYDAPGDPVTADTPSFLPPFPKDQPRNRLGLARWLLSPQNPLTSRVIVNRAWQQMFGHGLVETPDNFGTQGSLPTHPDLLDYLALEFQGPLHWNMKSLLKTIALSATYRQSSQLGTRNSELGTQLGTGNWELGTKDPDNHLLARGPSRRLSAEMLRDQSLFNSNLLVEKLGGPSVKPYQPDGLWDVAMGRPQYDQSHGEGLYRRSLYTFWKRSVPPPAMTILDAADKNVCTVRRQSTSTPLQSLALLNDPQYVEAARFLAQRTLTDPSLVGQTSAVGGGIAPVGQTFLSATDGGTPPSVSPTADQQLIARLSHTFRLLTSRPPTDKELAILKQLCTDQLTLFTKDPASADKLLNVGEKRNDTSLNRADLAAHTIVALTLFNHDAAVTRR